MYCPAAGLAAEADQQELLLLHEAVLAAHRDNDLDSWMQDESDDYVMVSRGEIQFWAWIELYEKRHGQWLRTGNVSNHKPE
jgi:hypothetical protein